ncbi:flagellar motor protein MotB [Moellerella wisconsensis]|uniref:MotB family flagellar motor rotation protein n=1 Tax=Moellerella wisconsensis ATCC 35017 TaxID=1354267 RepID=A0A0N0Z7N3_9GAMM|nr:flagellar motor protein MotB [Moellerella wisconsensis]KPD02347.1 MotB family flagellar motor rotation protein [Moellerella wisconsensis ATCC 35017]VFS54009.1 Chemotaxis protein MotB [Moellerella wisconsensis]
MKNNKPTIIIKKRKSRGGHGGHHGGSWKIAYADFMTAMMSFFLVMWIISISSPQEIKMLAEYFRIPINASIHDGQQMGDTENFIPNEIKGDFYQTMEDFWANNEGVPDDEEERFHKLQNDLESIIDIDPRLKEMKQNLLIELTEDGLQIQITDGKNRPMFASGSASLDIKMQKTLYALAPVINSYPNRVSISGHTDNRPFSNIRGLYSNWELSADRANTTRRALIKAGVDDVKILQVIGMASTLPISADGGAAENRRITIIVLNKETEEHILKRQIAIQKKNTI